MVNVPIRKFFYIVFFLLLWGIFTDFSLLSFSIGIPAAILSLWILSILPTEAPSPLPSLTGITKFLSFFLTQSLLGGIDILKRSMVRQLNIHPGFLTYKTSLEAPISQSLLCASISMIPGTLCIHLDQNTLTIHTIDTTLNHQKAFQKIESLLKEAFR